MSKISHLVVLLVIVLSPQLHANTSIGTELSNAIIKRYSPTIDNMTHHGWDHSNSVIIHAMEKIYRQNKIQII